MAVRHDKDPHKADSKEYVDQYFEHGVIQHGAFTSVFYLLISLASMTHSDMLSKRRSRSVARPRQLAMSIAKELTSHSLPEIGESFGGRDHTTVLHACRKVKELEGMDREVQRDLKNLYRALST